MDEERKMMRSVSNEDREIANVDPNSIESTLTDMNMHRMGSTELEQVVNTFKQKNTNLDVCLDEILGEGAYGKVYKALNKHTGKFLAVKFIKVKSTAIEHINMFEQEIALLARIQHQNIVQYLGCDREFPEDSAEGVIKIYMEYMVGGSISSMLKQFGPFEEAVIARFTRQILYGLQYLHSQGIAHRDLKGGNILAHRDGTVKLADFGACKFIQGLPLLASNSEMCNSMRGSLYWMAPEILKEEGYGRKVDIWSLGCTIIEMATGVHPWQGITTYPALIMEVVNQNLPQMPETLSEDCKDFVLQCLQYEKKARPTPTKLLKHPFVSDKMNN